MGDENINQQTNDAHYYYLDTPMNLRSEQNNKSIGALSSFTFQSDHQCKTSSEKAISDPSQINIPRLPQQKSAKKHKTSIKQRSDIDKKYKCDHCQYSTNNKSHFQRHSFVDSKEKKPFKCEHPKCGCNKGFATKQTLDIHILRVLGIKKFKCTQCEKTYVTSWELRSHSRLHSMEKQFKCTHVGCNKRLTSKYSLEKHLRIHSGEKPFKCSHRGCNKRFRQKCHLKQHLLTHSKLSLKDLLPKKFRCSFDGCNREFATKYSLNIHIKRHLGIKNHKCSYCGKSFVTKGTLDSHTRTHTGEKPFECKHCQKKFNQHSNLKAHIKSMHKHAS